MVQRIEEKDGYMLLYFGNPPENIGQIEFVNCVAYQQNRILFCKWRDDDIWVLPGGRIEPEETVEEALHRELNSWRKRVLR
jgi:8-oxo-dGTP pyrophosphatase MutT (NUDIX family)